MSSQQLFKLVLSRGRGCLEKTLALYIRGSFQRRGCSGIWGSTSRGPTSTQGSTSSLRATTVVWTSSSFCSMWCAQEKQCLLSPLLCFPFSNSVTFIFFTCRSFRPLLRSPTCRRGWGKPCDLCNIANNNNNISLSFCQVGFHHLMDAFRFPHNFLAVIWMLMMGAFPFFFSIQRRCGEVVRLTACHLFSPPAFYNPNSLSTVSCKICLGLILHACSTCEI